ncbi:helix-turn-helix domain-containing protein [Gracilibacillus massiliensis]|uniref:helix-turn-helix domain-containing protein n=1 Tax=Gracilibacillus massiliensis TaxID=1564956 RepID=UPI00071C7494|nr:helix-turn-helix transcriptional regulator [Gracilibacillus massiliensis]
MLKRGEFFVALVKQKGFSIKEISEKIEVPYSTLLSMIKRDFENASINKMIDICNVLDIKVEDLFTKELSHAHLSELIKKPKAETFISEQVIIEFIEKDLNGLLSFLNNDARFTSQLFYQSNNIPEEDKKMLLIYIEQALKVAKKMKNDRY